MELESLKTLKKTCEECGEVFYVKKYFPNARYCSNECRLKHLGKTKRTITLITLTCAHCNKEFTVNSARKKQKYCCNNCRFLAKKIYVEKIKKICIGCGKEFEVHPIRGKQKYCGDKCRIKYLNIYHKRENKAYVKNCVICGKTFTSYNINAKYCCYGCFKDYYRPILIAKDKARTKPKPIITCQCCGKEFEVLNCNAKKTKYCSNECRVISMRKNAIKKKKLNSIYHCLNCGKLFSSPYPKKYCSSRCNLKVNTYNLKPSNKIKKICKNEFCKKEFYVKGHDIKRKFCCYECHTYFMSKKYKEDLLKLDNKQSILKIWSL